MPDARRTFGPVVLAGLASVADDRASTLVDGCTMGSLSMTAYTLGLDATTPPSDEPPPALPDDIPPADTNI